MEFLHKDKVQFLEAINLSSYQTHILTPVVEKDYYVTMILRQLSETHPFVVFKGGTSLSKCHRVINRFSEDIDITIDQNLSQGQKKKLKDAIIEIAKLLGMRITNLEDTKSRRDYNRYILEYDTVLPAQNTVVSPAVLIETSFVTISFPTSFIPVHSYMGDMMQKEAPEILTEYGLDSFIMKVQGIDRTLVDKIFAVCDYYLQNKIKKHSRHLYDIYKLLPLVKQDENFCYLIREVRDIRAKSSICPSAQLGVDIPTLLQRILDDKVYKEDYENLTVKLLEEVVSYEEAMTAIEQVIHSGVFVKT